MTSVWGNPFKLQFFPSFESQVLAANMLAIPIVSGNFVQVSVQSSKLVDIEQFLIFVRNHFKSDFTNLVEIG